jgi:hypothetical protein
MVKRFIKSSVRNCGDNKASSKEEPLEDIKFNIYKFNNRPKPEDKRQKMIICSFSEFGCETLGCLYCVPNFIKDYPGKYKILVGWYGRKYLYQHLVDEFWEIKSEHMWLREYSRAFHHQSKNLSKIEKSLKQHGIVVPSNYMGKIALCSRCLDCRYLFSHAHQINVSKDICPKCNSKNVIPPLIEDIEYWKPKATKLPEPESSKNDYILKFIKKPCVGIFARGRKCYGRNLQPEFYIKLIKLLEDMGYNPIWLGEKVSTLPCPVPHILDFSRMEESKDLEYTLSIIKNCEFTIQFWTASTRLSGMQGVPYILFESPDQIWGQRGQEGIRRNLCDFGPRKLSVNHFLNVYNDNDKGIEVVKRCIEELNNKNYEDNIGLVEDYNLVLQMKKENDKRIGGEVVHSF